MSAAWIVVCSSLVGSAARADTVGPIVPVGNAPRAIGINPITNKIYVANDLDGTVSVVDGNGERTETVTVGSRPRTLAVNPVTNRIYVGNLLGQTISVIDGENLSTETVSLGALRPTSLAVNPVTNRIYVATSTGEVLVLDGNDNSIETLATGGPVNFAITVDTWRNKIYVTRNSNEVLVINGSDHTFSTRAVGDLPGSITVNPVTGEIYVTNRNDNDLSIFDCASGYPNIPTGSLPTDVTVDPVRNLVRVANEGNGTLTNYNRALDIFAQMTVGRFPQHVFNNHLTGKDYVHCAGDATVWSFDTLGAEYILPVPVGRGEFAVNPITNRVYFASETTGEVAAIDSRTEDQFFSLPNQPRFLTFEQNAINPVTGTLVTSTTLDQAELFFRNGTSTSFAFPVGLPVAKGVDPTRGFLYVASYDQGALRLLRLDENDLSRETIVLSPDPPGDLAMAVHPFSGKVYVFCSDSGQVHVIDAEGNQTIVLSLPPIARAVEVDVAKNKIYAVYEDGGGSLYVINGVSDTVEAVVPVGNRPSAIEVAAPDDRIFVANEDDGTLTVIDRENLTTQVVTVGDRPIDLLHVPSTREVYVANHGDDSVTILKATDLSTVTTVSAPQVFIVSTSRFVFNQSTGTVYVGPAVSDAPGMGIDVVDKTVRTIAEFVLGVDPGANRNYGLAVIGLDLDLVLIDQTAVYEGYHQVSISPLPGNLSFIDRPTFQLSATTSDGPADPSRTRMYYQMETWRGQWTPAPPGASASIQTPPLSPGFHLLHVFSTDGQDWTGSHQCTPFIGEVSSYGFMVLDCAAGNVNRGATGNSQAVLLVNGSDGGEDRSVIVGTGAPVTVAMNASQSGPATNAKYVFWTWAGELSGGTGIPLLSRTELLGCLVYPTPLHSDFGPQPLFCVRSSGLPDALCRMTQEKPGPPRAPFSITNPSGIGNPIKLTLQGLLQDAGSEGTIAFSVTNAVVLCVE